MYETGVYEMSNIIDLARIKDYNKAEAAEQKQRGDLHYIGMETARLIEDGIDTQEVIDFVTQALKILIK